MVDGLAIWLYHTTHAFYGESYQQSDEERK
jgi:hypothetical protein